MTDLEYALNKIRHMSKLSCDLKDKLRFLSETIDEYADTLDGVYASLKNEKEKQNNPWIPVDKHLPETDGMYIVTFLGDTGWTDVGWNYYTGNSWNMEHPKVIAWMSAPKPYNPREKEERNESNANY